MNIPYATALPVIIFLALTAMVYLLEAQLLARYLWRTLRRKPPLSPRRHHVVIHTLAVTGVLCILYGTFVEPYWPDITTVRLETDKLHTATLRIVQISDLHCDPTARLEPRLPDLVNSLKPDVIVFTGDAINSADALGLFQQTLAAMDAPLGKFAVRGNWDYLFPVNLFEETGFEELTLQAVRLEKNGESFMLCGVAYHNGRFSQRAINQLDPATWNCLLYHTPDLIEYMGAKPIDLYLCGHTHGGQVALPFYGALATMTRHGKKYEAGRYAFGTMAVYVNRGIGMGGIGPRVRFFARPEITLFEIHPTGAAPSETQESQQD